MLNDADLLRRRIDAGASEADLGPRQLGPAGERASRALLPIEWPAGLEPTPAPLAVEPAIDDPLPEPTSSWSPGPPPSGERWPTCSRPVSTAPVAGTATPATSSRTCRRSGVGHRPGSSRRLGAYHPTRIGTRSVLCFKSELHLNQDGVRTGDGTATLPVADLVRQLIAEVRPKLVITTGTCGATFPDHELGDVLVTRGAAFRLEQEFRNEPYARQAYRSPQRLRRKHLTKARELMAEFARAPRRARLRAADPAVRVAGRSAARPAQHP